MWPGRSQKEVVAVEDNTARSGNGQERPQFLDRTNDPQLRDIYAQYGAIALRSGDRFRTRDGVHEQMGNVYSRTCRICGARASTIVDLAAARQTLKENELPIFTMLHEDGCIVLKIQHLVDRGKIAKARRLYESLPHQEDPSIAWWEAQS
jgi:hypothetical protein